jgi:hypothetical protein
VHVPKEFFQEGHLLPSVSDEDFEVWSTASPVVTVPPAK